MGGGYSCYVAHALFPGCRYIAVISHVLRPGGLWVNAGPLHYHMGGRTRIPYSAAELQQVVVETVAAEWLVVDLSHLSLSHICFVGCCVCWL